jgi:hypothetical protein
MVIQDYVQCQDTTLGPQDYVQCQDTTLGPPTG